MPEKVSQKIRICYFCSLDSFDTGMPISTFKLISYFAGHPDFHVSVILPGRGELYQRIRQSGIEPQVIAFKRLRSPRRLVGFLAFFLSYPSSLVRLRRYLKENRTDIVHFSDIIDAPFYPCGRLAGVKTIAHLRHCIENAVTRIAYFAAARLFTDKVICISHAVRQYCGLGPRRAEVIYNPGPDLRVFNPHAQPVVIAEIPRSGNLVVSVGKFLRVKGHEHFVRLAQRIERTRPGFAKFIIVGSPVPGREAYRREISDLILSLGLNQVVSIIDHLPHESIPGLLARSSVFTLTPNWQEGLGGVVLEAMAMEVPIVAFNCGGIAECFTHGVSGFLVDPYDVPTAAARTLELLENTKKRKEMGTNARKELLSKFSLQNYCNSVESVYRQVLIPKSR